MRFPPGEKGRPMITWNYRVFREDDGDYVIREVFYSEDGAILGCTEKRFAPANSAPSSEVMTTSPPSV